MNESHHNIKNQHANLKRQAIYLPVRFQSVSLLAQSVTFVKYIYHIVHISQNTNFTNVHLYHTLYWLPFLPYYWSEFVFKLYVFFACRKLFSCLLALDKVLLPFISPFIWIMYLINQYNKYIFCYINTNKFIIQISKVANPFKYLIPVSLLIHLAFTE